MVHSTLPRPKEIVPTFKRDDGEVSDIRLALKFSEVSAVHLQSVIQGCADLQVDAEPLSTGRVDRLG